MLFYIYQFSGFTSKLNKLLNCTIASVHSTILTVTGTGCDTRLRMYELRVGLIDDDREQCSRCTPLDKIGTGIVR